MIKSYDKSRECPYILDLAENFESYLENCDFSPCIERAFNWANRELTQIVMSELKMVDRLKSVKSYFFLKAGDYFVHFMDSA